MKTTIISTLFFCLCSIMTAYARERNQIRIAMTGDIMMGTTYPDSIQGIHLPKKNGRHLFDHVTSIIKDADAAFGNLESNFLNSGGKFKDKNNKDAFFIFRTPEKLAKNLKNAGFNAVSIANNHTNDLGETGRASTRRTLKSLGIAYAGHTGSAQAVLFEEKGIKYGFCAFSYSPMTPSIFDLDAAKTLISSVRSECDILVVSFHGGAEGVSFKHIPFKEETYMEQPRGNVVLFARTCIDAGADLVFGHGPHVLRAIELYKNHLIAYSLGNFCTPFRINLKEAMGYAPILVAELDNKGHFLKGNIYSFIQKPGTGPIKDEDNLAAHEIKELTLADSPDTEIIISDNGNIERTKTLLPDVLTELNTIIQPYLGKRYRRGAQGPSSFDCSGFTSFIYDQLGYKISRSSREQYQDGKSVSKKELQIGDLVFFGSRGLSRNINHVGIVVQVDPETGNFKFAHASNRGTVIDDFGKEAYYQQRYVGARRIIEE